MIIKRFIDFINEAYLKGGRQPLYHYTRVSHLYNILETNILKVSSVARPRGTKAICLTRNPYFTHDGGTSTSPRIVLDIDKLRRNGYNSFPVDEVGITSVGIGHAGNFTKSNIENIKSGRRTVHNNLDLPKPGSSGLEVEFEERIYKDIEDIGKYILSIDVIKESDLPKNLNLYLEEYPDIIINLYDIKKRNKVTDITSNITNKEKVSLNP